jgi:hypothetical protein
MSPKLPMGVATTYKQALCAVDIDSLMLLNDLFPE